RENQSKPTGISSHPSKSEIQVSTQKDIEKRDPARQKLPASRGATIRFNRRPDQNRSTDQED
ncbi:MAG: hypothetical protein AAF623_20135, partial [Planctomycetota bacterium]